MALFETFSAEQTKRLAYEMGKVARPSQVYCLCGELGAGKTVFSKGFAEGLGVNEDVTSPTFGIINEYYGDKPLYHFDVYRIRHIREMEDTGYEDYFYGEGVCLVEWANMIRPLIPSGAIWVTLSKDMQKGEHYRIIEVNGNEYTGE